MKKRVLERVICLPIIILTIIATIVGNVVANKFSSEINSLLCPPVVNEKLLADSAEEGQRLAKQIMQEGTVLVKNENVLPLNKENDKKINVFGHSSVDWGFGGSGSGRVRPENGDFSTMIDLLGGLKRYGIEYNSRLESMYKDFKRIGRIEEAQDKNFYAFYEPEITDKSYYSDELLSYSKSYSQTAIVTITRFGSEGVDHTQASSNKRSDLSITIEEEELLQYVGANYEKVIVVINSANTMELGFMDTILGLDACVVVGLTGTQSASAIPSVLYGEATPSGKLADTYAYDFEQGISHCNYGQSAWYKPYGFYQYIEGIYVGYKWYETADVMGIWDSVNNQYGTGYNGVVQYPFGYGLSYTNFEWTVEDYTVKEGDTLITSGNINQNSEITLKINVKNTGEVQGQDVVELYITTPYKDGGIEKASVSLVGYGKTSILEPNESQILEIVVNADDFASYDCYDKNNNGHKGYELENGEYQLKLMTDAHNLKNCENNILKFNVPETIKILTDKYSNKIVSNKFTGDSACDKSSIDGNDGGAVAVNYISRSNFPYPQNMSNPANMSLNDKQINAMSYSENKAVSWDNATVDNYGNTIEQKQFQWNQQNNLKITENGRVTDLGYKLGADYDDPDWQLLLNQLSIDEATNLISNAYAANVAINSIGKPKLSDYDGPSQIKGFSGTPRGTGYPGEPVVAQTWNKKLARQYGRSFGNDMNALGVAGLYGFGCNIHRSPFCGRNFEYFSEDGFLSGSMLTESIIGIQSTGRYAYIKHLVLNDGEAGRNGAFTWCTEQALREIYLKPFKMAVQQGDCMAIMSAYNRVGATYSGGSQGLINGVLREEWNYKGAVITDCSGPATSAYMNMDQALRAGGDLGMATTLNSSSSGYTLNYSSTSSNRLQYQMREAVHHVTYMYLHTQYLNKVFLESGEEGSNSVSTTTIESWAWWRVVIIDINIFIGLGCALWTYMLFRNIEFFTINEKKEEQL